MVPPETTTVTEPLGKPGRSTSRSIWLLALVKSTTPSGPKTDTDPPVESARSEARAAPAFSVAPTAAARTSPGGSGVEELARLGGEAALPAWQAAAMSAIPIDAPAVRIRKSAPFRHPSGRRGSAFVACPAACVGTGLLGGDRSQDIQASGPAGGEHRGDHPEHPGDHDVRHELPDRERQRRQPLVLQ